MARPCGKKGAVCRVLREKGGLREDAGTVVCETTVQTLRKKEKDDKKDEQRSVRGTSCSERG